MSYTYPGAPATIAGDALTIDRFLSSPTLVARRLRTLLENRFIADRILTGRYEAEGGSVVYETGESEFADSEPGAVAPGSGYPTSTVGTGQASVAQTRKWGLDALVTDEAVRRRRINPVNRAMTKLANSTVQRVDTVALSAVASAVTATQAATASWVDATAQQILLDASTAAAEIRALNEGYDPDIVLVDDVSFAIATAKFGAAGYYGREGNSENPLITGMWPTINGMVWLATPNVPTAGVATVLDSSQLGGMADEDLGGPGYVSAGGIGVQSKTIREDKEDQWRLRARRVTVPVVNEPAAARTITGIAA